MIVNTYAVLDAFLVLLRLAIALLVIGLGVAALRGRRRAIAPDARGALEDRNYLLFLLAALLLALNLASWPLFYLLLESYVPEWPGVMCVYGVTRVGSGSDGPSRFLPGLLQALQLLKPALVFGSGAWAVLYLADRRTATSPLMGRVLVTLIGLGVLAVIDSAAEGAYLVIPKKEVFLADGCCTAAPDGDRFAPAAFLAGGRAWLGVAYFAANAGMVVALAAAVRLRPRLRLLLAGAAVTLAVSAVFLIDVAAPALLRLPHHHCPYDLIGRAPESLAAVASFAAGTFAVGWAWMTARFADCPETRPFLAEHIRKTLVIALFAYLGALVMMSVELALV